MGGSDAPSNIEFLTYEQHVQAHKLLSEKYPDHFGLRFAYLNMKGLSEEAHREACCRGGQRSKEVGGPAKGGKAGGKLGGKITGTKNLKAYWKKHPEKCKENSANIGRKFSKKIKCIETGQIFESINAAMRAINSSNIASALKNKTTAKGYHWEYV